MKVEKSIVENVLFLPDFKLKTVNLLLDLLYEGKTDSVGDLDPISGDLCINQLYNCLVFSAENGGLPEISDLDVIPAENSRSRVFLDSESDSEDVKIVGIFRIQDETLSWGNIGDFVPREEMSSFNNNNYNIDYLNQAVSHDFRRMLGLEPNNLNR